LPNQDCYQTASLLRSEPRHYCAWVQHANHSATEPPTRVQGVQRKSPGLRLRGECPKSWRCSANYTTMVCRETEGWVVDDFAPRRIHLEERTSGLGLEGVVSKRIAALKQSKTILVYSVNCGTRAARSATARNGPARAECPRWPAKASVENLQFTALLASVT